MRRVIFTESQINEILQAESAYPLDIKGDDGRSDNFTELETAVNNTDKDISTNVTTSDNIKRCKKGWYLRSTLSNHYRLSEGDELDNMKTSGYGQKNDQFISKVAANNGGKMVSNLNAEIQSNKDASRNNTNQVRVSRLETQKKKDPATFQKNGGQRTLNILKNEVKAKSGQHSANVAGQPRKENLTPNASKAPESHHGPTAYYFN